MFFFFNDTATTEIYTLSLHDALPIQAIRVKAAIEKKFGIQSEYLDSTDLKTLAPYISDDMIGAMFYPEEGKANPLLVVPAFAAQAEKQIGRAHV